MSQPEVLETVSNENKEYSEWRLLYSRGVRGCSFETVVVNEGFQNKDFQTSQGVFSVIDPEILGKLRKEATAIRNTLGKMYIVILGALYLVVVVPVLLLFPDDIFVIASFGVYVILGYIAGKNLRTMTDVNIATLVESYQPRFLAEYGVELGYGRFSSSPQGGGCCKVPGIYLRHPRRLEDEEQTPVGGDCDDLDGGRIPPIFVFRLIPGEIDIGEKDYDASSMKVDAETWALLQSTHGKMIRWHPILKCLAILCFIGSFVVQVWIALKVADILRHIISIVFGIVVYIMFKNYEYVPDRLNRRACEEVTKVVNEALQKDKKNKAQLALEFHDSELPGREGKLGRRYRFVELALTPTRNELE